MSDLPERSLASATSAATNEVPAEAARGADPDPASAADAGAGPAERPGTRAVMLRFVLVGVLLVLDLWSKAAAFRWLEGGAPLEPDACDFAHRRVPLLGEWFGFMRSQNKGAAFGQLDSVPYLLVGGRVAAVLFLSYLIVRTSARKRVLTAAFVLILAGALGNLYDNLVLEPPAFDAQHPFGYVRDFIDVYFTRWSWHFPTFNVADSCITVGAVLLLLSGFRDDSEASPASDPAGA